MTSNATDIGWFAEAVEGFKIAGAFQQAELIITVVGFLITGATAIRALQIAKRIRDKIIVINSVADIAKAHAIIEEIRRFLRSRTWVYLPDRCTELRHILVAVSNNPSLSEEHQKMLQKAISTTQAVEEKINANIQNGLTETEMNKADRGLIQVSNTLNILNIQTKQKVK